MILKEKRHNNNSMITTTDENKVLTDKIVKIINTDKSLTESKTKFREIKYLLIRSQEKKDMLSPVSKMIKDFSAQHAKPIRIALVKKNIVVEEDAVKRCVIDYFLVNYFSEVFSWLFEEKEMSQRQVKFDAKLEKCRELPKKYWCKSYVQTTSFEWLRTLESLYNINSFHSPFSKLKCIKTLINNVTQIVSKELFKTKGKKEISSDDLLPVLIYAVISSSSPMLLINAKFIEKFIPDDFMRGEEGYCLITLLLATEYIEKVDLNQLVRDFKDDTGSPDGAYEGEEEESWVIVD